MVKLEYQKEIPQSIVSYLPYTATSSREFLAYPLSHSATPNKGTFTAQVAPMAGSQSKADVRLLN